MTVSKVIYCDERKLRKESRESSDVTTILWQEFARCDDNIMNKITCRLACTHKCSKNVERNICKKKTSLRTFSEQSRTIYLRKHSRESTASVTTFCTILEFGRARIWESSTRYACFTWLSQTEPRMKYTRTHTKITETQTLIVKLPARSESPLGQHLWSLLHYFGMCVPTLTLHRARQQNAYIHAGEIRAR